jgi:hypothetical protein
VAGIVVGRTPPQKRRISAQISAHLIAGRHNAVSLCEITGICPPVGNFRGDFRRDFCAVKPTGGRPLLSNAARKDRYSVTHRLRGLAGGPPYARGRRPEKNPLPKGRGFFRRGARVSAPGDGAGIGANFRGMPTQCLRKLRTAKTKTACIAASR